MSFSPSDSPQLNRPVLLTVSLLLIVIWGSAFTLVGYAVDYISPLWLVIYRLIVGTICMTTWTYIKGAPLPPLSDKRWRYYGGLGITGSVLPFYLISVGQLEVDSGLTAIIVGASPLITIILAHFLTDERLTLIKLVGFIIGFIGIILLFLPDDFSFNLVAAWKSQLIILLAGASYASTTVLAKRAPKTSASIASTIMLLVGCFISLCFGLATGIPETLPKPSALFAAIALGIGSTGIATLLFIWLIDQTGPTYVANVNYFVPAASVIFGVLFMDEIFTWKIALALGIILGGVMISRIGQNNVRAKTQIRFR